MNKPTGLSRRRLLTVAGAVAAGTAASAVLPVAASAAPSPAPGTGSAPSRWTASRSQNEWPVIDRASAAAFRVEGSDATATLLTSAGEPSDAATTLLHVARRFHYDVAPLAAGDIHGHLTDRTIAAGFESNRLSGTAIALRPQAYPVGSAGNLYPYEVAAIRRILADCEGVVSWHGDDPVRAGEGHFSIGVPPGDARLARVAAKIRGWQATPGMGAGATP
jgi:hypothetical protein